VVGVPDERWGETGAAFLVTKSAIDEDEIRRHCQRFLAKFKIPKHLFFMEALPKNATGKIDKKTLQKQFINQHKHS
jgi:fatty-acyl-CoA synthase